ncbi:PHD-type domain-containing protein [Trichoderma simmonsii]|uniref:PHD-type domain-containing protein n=1 Tax=Trichoderma simmonsii TaxID=1491479 RepID=A0A8G0PGF0_9HYPO|nr:PHD-type domain-containing protein [Trichoderma simmonsii]
MAESAQSQAKRRRTSTAEISKYPVIAGYRISTYAAPGTVLTMNEQKIIYHAWKKSGSPHNALCYTCRKPGSMLNCPTCCRSYHQNCVVPKVSERQKTFYCDACTKRGWHIQPPSFEDNKSNHLHTKPASEPDQRPAAKPEELKPSLEARRSNRLKKDIAKSEDTGSSSTRVTSRRSSEEDASAGGQGDVMHSLQSLRERVITLEKENEALRLSSRTKNPRKREHTS